MAIDISKSGGKVKITGVEAIPIYRTLANVDYNINPATGSLDLLVDKRNIVATFGAYTISGASPASAAAAETALALVFPEASSSAEAVDAIDYSAKLPKFKANLQSSPSALKIALLGDSTSDLAGNASGIPALVAPYTTSGDVLQGFNTANILDFGSNGQTLADWLSDSANLTALVTAAPDLIVFCFGINDARTNTVTSAQLKALIITAIESIQTALPNAEIILRMPNSFLTVDAGGLYIQQGSYGSIALAAQGQSIILYNAYKELENYWPDVVLFDTQTLIYGRTCVSSSPNMSDAIHPNYAPMIAELVKIIGYKEPFASQRAITALYASNGTSAASTYATPWTVYPRVLEYEKNFKKILSGRFVGYSNGVYIDIATNQFSGDKDAYKSIGDIIIGDIINIGDVSFTVIANTGLTVSAISKATTRIATGAIGDLSAIVAGTPVTVYRSIYMNTFAIEQYFNNKKDYPYRRRVYILFANNGNIRCSAGYDRADGLTTPHSEPNMTGEQMQLLVGDIVCANGETPVTLTGATFSPNGYMQIAVTGDHTSKNGKLAYIFGNHPYERWADRTITAAGTTGNRTINKQSGTVNIAAAGTSVTVTNSMVKTTSLISVWVRTNDSTALIKNVVASNGSFVINMNAAVTGETSIGFKVLD